MFKLLNLKAIKILLCNIIIIALLANLTFNATDNIMIGDLNNDNKFNAIDISILRIQLNSNNYYNIASDMNSDNVVDLKDLVRMKKYLSGEVINNNTYSEGFVWNVLNSDSDFAIISGIGYNFYTNCKTVTVYFSGRYVWETSAYISTDIYANPEYPQPHMVISSTTINGEEITMQDDDNILGDPNKLIGQWISCEEIYVPYRSQCSNVFSIMLEGAIYPHRDLTNEFEF